jgi:hypothetical protein
MKGYTAMTEVLFSEYHYTGNSPNGTNNGNYDELERWFIAAGLTIKDDDLAMLMDNLEPYGGVHSLTHRGKTIHYRATPRPITQSNPQFGYRTNVIYTLLKGGKE